MISYSLFFIYISVFEILFLHLFSSLYLLRKKKERNGKRAEEEALESLESELRDKAETLGFSLEQKTKVMKQRDRKVILKPDSFIV